MYTIAKNAVEKGLQYQYRDRKNRKRVFRRLWIARINAGARLNGSTYSKLIHAMSQKNMLINRKVLADLAVHDPETLLPLLRKPTHNKL